MLCIRGTLSEGQACHPNQLDCFRETFRGKAFGAKDRWTCPSVPQAGRDRFIKQMNASAPRLSYRTHAKCTKAHISLIKFLVFPITHIRRALFLLTLGSFSARLAPIAVQTEAPCLPVPNVPPPPNPNKGRAAKAHCILVADTHSHHTGGLGRCQWLLAGPEAFPRAKSQSLLVYT